MTITVDIKAEVEAELVRQAASLGSRVEVYAAILLEDAVYLPRTCGPATLPGNASLRDVFGAVRGLADDIDFSRNPSTGRPIDLS